MLFRLTPIETPAKDACDLPRVVIAVILAQVVVVVGAKFESSEQRNG